MAWEPPRASRRPVSDRNTSSRSADFTDRASTATDGGVEPVEHRADASGRAPSLGRLRASASSSRAPPRSEAARSSCASSANSRRTLPPGHEPLQLARRALGDDPAVVEQRDPRCEAVGLLEVLRRQEDRDAVGHELADDLPHDPPAARVEAGRRLVEEDDPRLADERHRQVEPALHPARVRRAPAWRRRRSSSNRSSSSATRRRPSSRPRWHRSAIRRRFSSPVNCLSTAETWPVTPIRPRTAAGSRATSWPPTLTSPASAARSVDEDVDRRRLAGAVRPEEREDRALRRRRGRCRRGRPGRRTTCAGRGRGSPGRRWPSPSCRTSREAGPATASLRCRGPRRSAAEPMRATMSKSSGGILLAELLEGVDDLERRLLRRAPVADVADADPAAPAGRLALGVDHPELAPRARRGGRTSRSGRGRRG